MKFLGSILVIGISALSIVGCNKMKGEGTMVVKMTDAPGDYDSVVVEVEQVFVHYSESDDNGWTELPTNEGQYDLLLLQDGVTTTLVDGGIVPVGKINQMRLLLGDDNYVVIEDQSYPLLLSSQDKTGLKINVGGMIHDGDSIQITLDFDANASIVEEGNGAYRLKPVVKLDEILYY